MSTKISIKSKKGTDQGPGYHLYDDVLDSFDDSVDPPVYLKLEGVHVELVTIPGRGASVTITLPRDIARELGLLPAADGTVDALPDTAV